MFNNFFITNSYKKLADISLNCINPLRFHPYKEENNESDYAKIIGGIWLIIGMIILILNKNKGQIGWLEANK